MPCSAAPPRLGGRSRSGSRCYEAGHRPGCSAILTGSTIGPGSHAALPSENFVYVSIELSVSSGLIAARLPNTEKLRLHRVAGGDTATLLTVMAELRSRASARLGRPADVACCFEAGRDGF